jgi:hypothetical protein
MFTVATIQVPDGACLHLVAICSFCGDHVKAYRDKEDKCVLPAGWIRIGPRREVGSVYAVKVYRSVLMCLECVKCLYALGIEDAQFDLHCETGECDSCTVQQLKGVCCEQNPYYTGPVGSNTHPDLVGPNSTWRRRFGR